MGLVTATGVGIKGDKNSPLGKTGFEPVWGFSCQEVVLVLLPVLCSERESRSSFFNRAAGVKKVVHSGLRSSVNTLVAGHWQNAVSLFG